MRQNNWEFSNRRRSNIRIVVVNSKLGNYRPIELLWRRFDKSGLGRGLPKLKLQDPHAGGGPTIHLQRFEPPAPRGLQSHFGIRTYQAISAGRNSANKSS